MTDFSSILTTYDHLRAELAPYGADLVAVSKRQPLDRVRALVAHGHRLFGENRVADFLSRQEAFAEDDLDWHFIGTVQSKKVGLIAGVPSCIQSVDRYKLVKRLDENCKASGTKQRILLQFKVAQEEQKQGYALEDFLREKDEGLWHGLQHIEVQGIMGMTTLTDDYSVIRAEYRALRSIFERLRQEIYTSPTFNTLSMGMSNDYRVALDEGSTMIRVGSKLFGARPQ